jgi:hypothetical protein
MKVWRKVMEWLNFEYKQIGLVKENVFNEDTMPIFDPIGTLL